MRDNSPKAQRVPRMLVQSLLTKMMIRIEWCFLNSALFECWSTRNDDSHRMMFSWEICSEKENTEIRISEIMEIHISKKHKCRFVRTSRESGLFPHTQGCKTSIKTPNLTRTLFSSRSEALLNAQFYAKRSLCSKCRSAQKWYSFLFLPSYSSTQHR